MSDWLLQAVGPTPGVTGFTGDPAVTDDAGERRNLRAGRIGRGPGYLASDWVCTGGTLAGGDTLTLALGESAACTITNDDVAGELTLVKR